MQYENRQPQEGLNVSQEHALKRFAKLLAGAMVLVVILVFLMQLSGSWLAKRIPFSSEQKLAREVEEQLVIPGGIGIEHNAMQQYLNDLATRVAANMPMPEGMSVQVHYSSDDVFNAFATLGGNLVFFKGLVEMMPNENALAMVMAHEISHVLHRDPIASLGGSLASTLAMLLFTGDAGTGLAGRVLDRTGALSGLSFTRGMESEADRAAIEALWRTYGHVNGADTLFTVLKSGKEGATAMGWLARFTSTHPLDDDRIEGIATMAASNGWPVDGELTPLPAAFDSWLDP